MTHTSRTQHVLFTILLETIHLGLCVILLSTKRGSASALLLLFQAGMVFLLTQITQSPAVAFTFSLSLFIVTVDVLKQQRLILMASLVYLCCLLLYALTIGASIDWQLLWNGLVCQQPGQGQFGGQCQDMPRHLHAHTQPVRAVAWSRDARFLATAGDDNKVTIWYPAKSQTPLLTMQHQAPVMALAWSPNGRQVATVAGNTVTIWELQ